ncbi:MAG TPA: PEP-CTERM sorting domain-containing protein [Phycisphaerae bacterium]|nr:PEP-CTERM sorting domain-containing protein [Phycisphaerae bacterium]
MKKMKNLLICALTTVAITSAAHGSVITLQDLNSVVEFNPASQNGQFTWRVDGVDYMAKQWFWYRIGGAGPESSVDTLNLLPPKVTNNNFNPGDDTLALRYLGSGFRIDIMFILTGTPWGSRWSDIAETITIANTGPVALDFHFFQYVDLNLGLGQSDDTAWFPHNNAVKQTTANGLVASETVITPVPSHREVKPVPITLNKLNDQLPTTLDGTSGPVTGDVGWAYQWDVTIPVGGAFQISKDKQIVPEPATTLFLVLGGLAVSRRRCRV